MGNGDGRINMIISLKVLGSKRYQTFKVEDPEHISLTQLANYYFSSIQDRDSNQIESKGDDKVEYLFYSKVEQGILNPDLPLSQLRVVDEDQLLIIPTHSKFHLNPFASERRIDK